MKKIMFVAILVAMAFGLLPSEQSGTAYPGISAAYASSSSSASSGGGGSTGGGIAGCSIGSRNCR